MKAFKSSTTGAELPGFAVCRDAPSVALAHFAIALFSCGPVASPAAPYVPADDAVVVETVPARASDPRARELAALQRELMRDPRSVEAAVRLAEASFDAAGADGDPRYIGHAQAALAPWWELADPPPAVRVLRAMLRQFDHRFDAALADLDAVLKAQPDNARAWAWRTAILLVLADYDGARRSCTRLAALAPALIAATCRAQVDALTGHAAAAAAAIRDTLKTGDAGTDNAQRLWALTRLGEIEERRGTWSAAESAFREALALGVEDVYLRAAYADFLLDRGRAAEVLTLLQGRGRADVLLLRQALAARATHDAAEPTLVAELTARFAAARARGDTTHRKEEARFLTVLGPQDVVSLKHALALAAANYAQQREPADARILLEAAVAARDAASAAPALRWLETSGCEGQALSSLAARLKAMR